ncbi:hypothetical protein DB32_006964 [Sandaracinus amylolyticus]|uniref:Uncharacterized protein n=1 Tax=Sandaracinus amylolyticus TaxID=927083 RepID=A0A0F6W888_9BACT|nr:hypothetical protein DB32_006964 [Sandaracinus amylolyticus]
MAIDVPYLRTHLPSVFRAIWRRVADGGWRPVRPRGGESSSRSGVRAQRARALQDARDERWTTRDGARRHGDGATTRSASRSRRSPS